MDRKVAFVHDTPLKFDGGAEISSRSVIQAGRDFGYDIDIFSPNGQLDALFDYDVIVLSNIWRFDKDAMGNIMQAICKVPYVKVERDHRSLDVMAEGKYLREDYAKKIFENSALNIFMSPDHKRDHRRILAVAGICIPPPVDVGKFKPIAGVPRKPNTALIGVPRKSFEPIGYLPSHDGGAELIAYIQRNPDIHFDFLNDLGRQDAEFLPSVPHEKMPEIYSRYEYFVHLPQGKWACDRVIFEAALCGCKVVANYKAGAISWGKNLMDIEGLGEWLRQAPHYFWSMIRSKGL